MDNNILDIANEAVDIGSKEISEATIMEHKNDLAFLKQAAQEYKMILADLELELSRFSQLLRRQSQIRKEVGKTGAQEVDEYIKNKTEVQAFLASDIPKRLYAASFKFQNQLNEFLGQQVKMVFVVEGSEGDPELYEMTSEEILKFDYSSRNQLTARYNVTTDDLGKSLKKIELTESNLNFSLSGLKVTYAEVLERYRIGRSQNSRLLMWKPGGSWKKMTISAEGDINEAYAAFVFLNKTSPSFANSMEYNIDDFAVGVAAVDNMSGLLRGDVTVDNIEYGIKSAGASTLGLKQMKTLADQILAENFDASSLQQVQKKMEQRAKTRNHISTLIDNSTDALLSEIAKRIK